MQLEISTWTHHLNHLLYSYYYYCSNNKIKFNIVFNLSTPHNSGILYFDEKSIFFDYSDDIIYLDAPKKYTFYFKRSLHTGKHDSNVYPLNFNVPISYKVMSMLIAIDKTFLSYKFNKTELLRALDYFHLKSNSAHSLLSIKNYPAKVQEGNGEAIYFTRLWNPNTTEDPLEKERRTIQNEFRINACKIISRSFKHSSVGLFPDRYSIEQSPDLVINLKSCKKVNYLKKLKKFNIGIADDGLKDTPGWKIGEYLLYGKAVISTPLNIKVDNFKKTINYSELSSRSAFKELPDAISDLQKNKKYIEMGQKNIEWSQSYIHPKNYITRILKLSNK